MRPASVLEPEPAAAHGKVLDVELEDSFAAIPAKPESVRNITSIGRPNGRNCREIAP